MSWGYLDGYNSVTSLNYRGTSYTDVNTTGNSSYRSSNYGLYPASGLSYGYNYLTNVRIGSTDVDVEEMISAGIVVCMAAGNRSHKIDLSAGLDYNNSVTTDQGTLYYHRGSSPNSPNGIIVGSLDSTTNSSTLDQKATYSETGPAVDIWAPGTNIMSATSTTNSWGAGSQNYYLNASYRQTNISGTSMASPQVCGIAALFFELYPTATPAQIKAHLLNYAGSSVYSTGNTTDYSDSRSLLGSAQKVVYTQFTSSLALSIGGSIAITANFGLV
jgi:hypothetical protein